MAGFLLKLLDFALLVAPVVVEWIKRRRAEEESATSYVRKVNDEKLKTWEAMEEGGMELTRLTRYRLQLARELRLRREIAAKTGNLQT